MYKNNDAKKEYFKNRYETHKEDYKRINNNYWYNYAKKKLNKDDVTEEEIKKCKNEYYKNYRKEHPVETKKTMDKFYENWSNKNKEE